jgi:hypothetical protein
MLIAKLPIATIGAKSATAAPNLGAAENLRPLPRLSKTRRARLVGYEVFANQRLAMDRFDKKAASAVAQRGRPSPTPSLKSESMPEKSSSLLECFWLRLAIKWVVLHSLAQSGGGGLGEFRCSSN